MAHGQMINYVDYSELWTTAIDRHALLRIDKGYVVYDKSARRALMLEANVANYVIKHMLVAGVEVWDDQAAAS